MSAPAAHGDRSVAFFTAIVAVLAALGTLFANHTSIQTLSVRNDVLLHSQQATDRFAYYQNKQLKVTLYQALLTSQLARGNGAAAIRHAMAEEQRSSFGVYAQGKALEARAETEKEHADGLFHAYETLEIATTLFEISIAFASIAALTQVRITLWAACVLTAIGAVTAVIGYLQAH